MNGSLAAGLHAGLLDRRLAVAAAQDQERVLAEERVAADVLAAFDALEQERVVRVLGDLQERRHRRQQVGHDLAPHRHERAAPRQLHELVERRLFHVLPPIPVASERPAAPRSIDGGAAPCMPVHHSNWRHACATSISRPPIVSAPGFARPAKQPWFRAGCRPGRRRAARPATSRRESAPRRRRARCRPASR